jgi:UDPglucose 6-dehydrogenase
VKALIAFSQSLDYNPQLLQAVEAVNHSQSNHAIALAKERLGTLQNRRIAILGLSFKPNTSDMREARSIPLISRLLQEGAEIIAYDPTAIPNAKTQLENKIAYASSPINCLKNADCCILVTEWDEFRKLTPDDFMQNMRNPILIDGRRIYPQQQFAKKLQFAAIGLG